MRGFKSYGVNYGLNVAIKSLVFESFLLKHI